MKKALIVLGAVLLVAVGILYLLGRGQVEEKTGLQSRMGLGESTRLNAVTLYFGDPASIALRPETRIVVAGPDLTARLTACVGALAAGSLTGGLPVLPEDTRLRRAYVDPSGLAYLDFERSILGERRAGDGEEWLAVASLVRTLCDNFPEVRRVRFMIEGKVVTSLSGYIDLEEPLSSADFPLAPAGS